MVPITTGLSPNTEKDDYIRAWKMLFSPWLWKKGNSYGEVLDWLGSFFGTRNIYLFSSGRSALTAIFHAFGIGKKDEVIVQAFTCMVVANAICFSGATPVYVDIDATLNIDPNDLIQKITSRTKAIVVQHTFGVPADMEAIVAIAKKYHIYVIEDCAHAFGATYKGKKVGTIGDAAIFSFGRDKVLSSVYGGAALIRDKWTLAKKAMEKQIRLLPYPSVFWIAQQLMHPITMSIVLPLYNTGIGKALLFAFQKLRFVSYPVGKKELHGIKINPYMMQYPNALAALLVGQLAKFSRYAEMREETVAFYKRLLAKKKTIIIPPDMKGSICLRYTILVDNPRYIYTICKKQEVILGNWYHNVIDPQGSDFTKACYRIGSCPNAEKYAKQSLNLPTRLTSEQRKHMANVLLSVL